MLSLHLFGGLQACVGEQPLAGRAAHRKRLALVALLATARSRTLSRDKLAALLWPECDVERARHQLATALYDLRKAGGEDLILAAGDDLRLNPSRITCDLWGFDEFLARGEQEQAVQCYAGPLLDGFFLSDAAEFERHIEGERDRYARLYERALKELTVTAEAQDDFAAATQWWRRLAVQDPYSGPVAVGLMRALAAAGNPAAAIQHASIHAALLGREFGADPNPEVKALTEQLRTAAAAGPARDDAGTERVKEDGPQSREPESVLAMSAAEECEDSSGIPPKPLPSDRLVNHPVPSVRAAGGRLLPWKRAALATLAVGALLMIAGHSSGRLLGWSQMPEPSVAVLPFDNLGPDSVGNGYFADGITEDLLTQLSHVSALRVISRTSVMRYRETEKSLREIGQELGVAYLVEGSVRRDGERVLITAQLIDATTDHHVWAGKYHHDLGDIFAVQAEIAQHIADSLAVKLTRAERQRIETVPTKSAGAYDFYLRGRDYFNRSKPADNEIAIELFRRALRADPSFALAHAGLADAYAAKAQALGQTVGWADSAVVSAKRAIALDSKLAEGHKALGTAYCAKKRYRDALPPLQRAVALNPNLYSAVSYMGNVSATVGELALALPWHRRAGALNPSARPTSLWQQAYDYTALGMFSEAEERLNEALMLQPDLMAAQRHTVILSLLQGRKEQAIERADQLVAAYPADAASWLYAATGVLLAGSPEQARPYYDRAYQVAPTFGDVAVGYGYVLWKAGERDRARQLFQEFETRARAEFERGNEDPGLFYGLASASAIQNDKVEANRWLRRAAASGWHHYYLALADPRLENLRGDAEFQEIMRSVEARLGKMRRQAKRTI